jgi:glycosyltransferase involved in cell wall biosynthesis
MIEAMASGGAVVALATPENREVGGDAVGYFELRPQETLSRTLSEWLTDREMLDRHRNKARQRAGERFRWEAVADAYENLLRNVTA